MAVFKTTFSYILLFVLLAVPGYILGKRGKIRREAVASLSNILMDIAMPFLVLNGILKLEPHSLRPMGILCSILFPVILTAVLTKITSLLYGKDPDGNVCAFCAAFSNCGFLGIPLALSIFAGQPAVAVYAAIFNVVNGFMIWTLGMRTLSNRRDDTGWVRALLNPVSAAIAAGLLLTAFGIPSRFPFLTQYSDYLASLTTPLSMTVLGFELSKCSFGKIFSDKRIYGVSALRLVLSPALTAVLLLLLRFHIPFEDAAIAPAMFLSAAVPTATTALAASDGCGANSALAARLTLGTTLLSTATLPLTCLIFERFL